jgi:hypothetical protein
MSVPKDPPKDPDPRPKVTIPVDEANPQYGGPLINVKYDPLKLSQKVDSAYRNEFQKILKFRAAILKGRCGFESQLELESDFPVPDASTSGSKAPKPGQKAPPPAPMIVISSSRAEQLRAWFQAAEIAGPLKGYTDGKTFDSGVIPWYMPERSNRDLYIVVHWSEYGITRRC